MSMTDQDLDSFYRFAKGQIGAGSDVSLGELVDLWLVEHPSADEHAENVAAIRGALDDMAAGDRGRPAGDVIAEVRRELRGRSAP